MQPPTTTDAFELARRSVIPRMTGTAAIAFASLVACATPAGHSDIDEHTVHAAQHAAPPPHPIPAPAFEPHEWTSQELTRLLAQQTALHAAHSAARVAEPNSEGPLLCGWSRINESTTRASAHPEHPARETDILLIGSSTLAWALRPSLENAATEFDWRLHNSARPSTSLARPDYYDWPTNLPRTIERLHPAVVVMQFGGNDCQALRHADGATEAHRRPPGPWRVGYADRVLQMVRIARENGARVLLLDLQSGRQAPYNRCVQEISKLLHQVALAASVPIHSVYDETCDAQRGYREQMHVNGTLRSIRSTDGLHLNTSGGTLAGRAVVHRLRQSDLLNNPPGDVCRHVTVPQPVARYPFDRSGNAGSSASTRER